MPIQLHHTYNELDSTKLKAYMRCPRRFFWEYIAGWRRDFGEESIHLVFGSAWHEAMEALLLDLKENGHYTQQGLVHAIELFNANYRQHFGPERDSEHSPKDPANAARALTDYVLRYKDDSFDVEFTEIAGTVPISDSRVLHFKIDALCKENGEYFVLEHKTTGQLRSSWADQFVLSVQVGTYAHAAYCFLGNSGISLDSMYGVKINGAVIRKSTNEFVRVPITRTLGGMQSYLATANHYVDAIERDTEEMMETLDDDEVMTAFPMNTESCTDFGTTCPFLPYCMSYNNPLALASGEPQSGFIRKYWSPKEEHADAKTKVEL